MSFLIHIKMLLTSSPFPIGLPKPVPGLMRSLILGILSHPQLSPSRHCQMRRLSSRLLSYHNIVSKFNNAAFHTGVQLQDLHALNQECHWKRRRQTLKKPNLTAEMTQLYKKTIDTSIMTSSLKKIKPVLHIISRWLLSITFIGSFAHL